MTSPRNRGRNRAAARATSRQAAAASSPAAPPEIGAAAPETVTAPAAAGHEGAIPHGTGGPETFLERWFVPLALGILLVAAALRLPELALNPFHHDEGVNGWFTTTLVRDGYYRYNPENYHGPSLYYLALASEIVFGLTTEAMRLVPALFGILTVGLVFPLRPYLGSIAALVAGALLAVSPGAVYVSRYFIHEALLVAGTIGLVAALVYYLDRREAKYLLGAAVSAALMFTTKESAVLTVVVLLIAVAVANIYLKLRAGDQPARTAAGKGRSRPREARPARGPSTSWSDIPFEHWAGAVVIFLVIYILLFSSFFTNFPQGIVDSLSAYVIWFSRGDATQVQPVYKYLEWMIPLDATILVLGGVGGVVAAVRIPSRLWVVLGLWALGITAALSIPQYKTPWIVLNMLLPLALMAGLLIAELWRRPEPTRFAAPLVFGAALLVSGYQAIELNFFRYDDEREPYVFVHSTRSMLDLVDEVYATAARAGTGTETGIVIMSPDQWPLPWYFRDYPRAGFYGEIVDVEEAMIIANVNQEAELVPKIQDRYDRIGTYNLRPGVDLVLFVRKDIPRP